MYSTTVSHDQSCHSFENYDNWCTSTLNIARDILYCTILAAEAAHYCRGPMMVR